MSSTSLFTRIAQLASTESARPRAFALAVSVVLLWALSGRYFDYSDTWQLVINTSTTVVTFLMVFLIQNAQSRDTRALEIKLDELIRVTPGAHLVLLDIEELDDDVLQAMQLRYEKLARIARERLALGETDTGTLELEL